MIAQTDWVTGETSPHLQIPDSIPHHILLLEDQITALKSIHDYLGLVPEGLTSNEVTHLYFLFGLVLETMNTTHMALADASAHWVRHRHAMERRA